ncbi:MAG: hypothetical protein GX785_14935 [Armatimonadetes bacterium]|jgi:peptidyl-prolyl cis-trans isomerase C|nr:hypothetical protein [Armatimonadota bacterium]HOM80447.1 peptidylprolyl isomerase [Armatimonadota bacterium]
MANSNRVGPNPKKKPAEPATVSKKRERRPVSATSSITSLTVLRNRLQHLTRWIFIGLGVVLVLGFGLVSVPNMRTETQGTGDVAKVNRKVIEREPFEALVRQTLDSPYSFMSGPTQELAVRNMLLDQEVDRILKLDAARRERNKVGRQQLAERIDQAVESVIQQQKSYYKTEEAFKEKYLKKRMKVKDETELRQKIRKEISPDWVKATREQILIENLERKIRNQASSLPLDKAKPEEIEYRVRHILIKAENRSDAKAKQAAQAILDQLKAGADFVKLAKEKSEDEATKTQGGDLDWLAKGGFYQYPELEQVVLETKPGQFSGPVKTSLGYHIVKVEDRRFSPSKHWENYVENLKKKAKIEVKDPVLLAYRQMTAEAKDDAERKKNREKAIAMFEKALEKVYAPDTRAAIYYTIGTLYSQDNQTAKAAEAFGQASQARPSPEISMALGDAQKKLNKKEAAIESYKLASDMASDTSSQQHYFTHLMLQSTFTEMGQKELAAKEKAWIDEFMKQQQSSGGFGFPGGTFTVP